MMLSGDYVAHKPDAVSNAGPLIHLSEIEATAAFGVLGRLLIPEEILNETRAFPNKKAVVVKLEEKQKDAAKFITASYSLQLGESAAIALALQLGIRLFLTDDLEARTVARHYNLEVHGTVGILVRAFANRIFTGEEVISFLRLLRTKSSLFITEDLLNWGITKVKEAESRRTH